MTDLDVLDTTMEELHLDLVDLMLDLDPGMLVWTPDVDLRGDDPNRS